MAEKIVEKFDSTDSMLTNAEQHTLHEAKDETRKNNEIALQAIKADLPNFKKDMLEYILDLKTLITAGGKASLQDDPLVLAYNTIKTNHPEFNLPDLLPYLDTDEGKKGLEEKAKFSDNPDIKEAIAEGNAAIEQAKEDEEILQKEIEKTNIPDGSEDENPVVKNEGEDESNDGEVVSENTDIRIESPSILANNLSRENQRKELQKQGTMYSGGNSTNLVMKEGEDLSDDEFQAFLVNYDTVSLVIGVGKNCGNCEQFKNTITSGSKVDKPSGQKNLVVYIPELNGGDTRSIIKQCGISASLYSMPLALTLKRDGPHYQTDSCYEAITDINQIYQMQKGQSPDNISVKQTQCSGGKCKAAIA